MDNIFAKRCSPHSKQATTAAAALPVLDRLEHVIIRVVARFNSREAAVVRATASYNLVRGST